MKLAYGKPKDGELESLKSLLGVSFGLAPELWTTWFARLGHENVRVLRKGKTVIGGLGFYDFGHFYGGKSVQSAGIAGVGIAPEHRGDGGAREMLIATLKEQRRRFPIASLFASTQYLYRSIGFEHAGHAVYYRAPAAGMRPASVDRTLEARRVDPTRDAFEAMYASVARTRPGHVARNEAMWTRKLAAQGNDEVYAYAFGPKSAPEGYVVYSHVRAEPLWFHLRVRDLVWLTPRAARSILRFFYDQRSLAGDVMWMGAPNDPLQLLFAEQVAKVEKSDRFFVRVLDPKKALEARGYERDGELSFNVHDPIIAENSRAWTLQVRDGVAKMTPAPRANLKMSVNALASLFTGMYDAHKLASVGALTGSDASIAAASALFAGPIPWIADMF